ncbi:MAG TPA: DUF5808 domain-containing protein [Nitriliruptoraceae bacterium]|nr:DUF5808 domain-containing protein [Nitriliruptoraceae bacterium]
MKTLRRLLTWIGLGLVVAAVASELGKPADERDWHGELGGIVPYDFRPPTMAGLKASWWAPDDPRLLTGRTFGVGWAINLARVAELADAQRQGSPTDVD